MSDEPRCWGCRTEAAVDGGLGMRCRAQLADRRSDPTTPALNDLIERLDDGYSRLCWDCDADLAVGISGLCPRCQDTLRG